MWLRNRRTGGWFELPDEEALKYKQISDNEKQREEKSGKNKADEFTQGVHERIVKELNASKIKCFQV